MFKSLVFVAGASLILGGCASHSHSLAEGAAPGLLKGELVHLQPSRLVLESGERKYVAEGFEVQRHKNLAELHKRYRMSEPKHWDRIFAGHDKSHETYSAEPAATRSSRPSMRRPSMRSTTLPSRSTE